MRGEGAADEDAAVETPVAVAVAVAVGVTVDGTTAVPIAMSSITFAVCC